MDSENVENDVIRMFGQIDVYLFDQFLKGRISRGMRILDAGCGNGRNLVFMLRQGFDVFAVDSSPDAMRNIQFLADGLAPRLARTNFRVENVERMTFADESFDVVLSIAVLHFAVDEEHFNDMISRMWSALAPGGMFFARLASSIGIEDCIRQISGRRYEIPDGSQRFLVDEALLQQITADLDATLLDPIKTVNVQNLRCMTNWCIRKKK